MSDITPGPSALPPADIPDHPTDILLELIVGLLAPMFLFGSNGNISHARLAAIETVNAYRIETQADLIVVAQIVAFGLAALSSLSQSMQDDLPDTTMLRLRTNAVACNRVVERSLRALGRHPPPARPIQPASAAGSPQPTASAASQSRSPAPAAPSRQPQPRPSAPLPPRQDQRAQWAEAMAGVAAEYQAGAAHLPPDAKADAVFRAGLLNSCASNLLNPVIMRQPPTAHGRPLSP